MGRLCRTFLHLAALAMACASVIFLALSCQEAQSRTGRLIKIVVPLPPGGAADIIARILSEQISRDHDVTVVVENRLVQERS